MGNVIQFIIYIKKLVAIIYVLFPGLFGVQFLDYDCCQIRRCPDDRRTELGCFGKGVRYRNRLRFDPAEVWYSICAKFQGTSNVKAF